MAAGQRPSTRWDCRWRSVLATFTTNFLDYKRRCHHTHWHKEEADQVGTKLQASAVRGWAQTSSSVLKESLAIRKQLPGTYLGFHGVVQPPEPLQLGTRRWSKCHRLLCLHRSTAGATQNGSAGAVKCTVEYASLRQLMVAAVTLPLGAQGAQQPNPYSSSSRATPKYMPCCTTRQRHPYPSGNMGTSG